jgi:hypothetical protein
LSSITRSGRKNYTELVSFALTTVAAGGASQYAYFAVFRLDTIDFYKENTKRALIVFVGRLQFF